MMTLTCYFKKNDVSSEQRYEQRFVGAALHKNIIEK